MAASDVSPQGYYIQHHMVHLNNIGDKQSAVADFSVINLDSLFWSILRRRIIDVQRRRKFRLSWLREPPQQADGSDIDWMDEREPDPARQHDSREAWTLLVRTLRKLPRRQREAFSLRVMEALDVQTTARIMGCSEGSVKTHLFRAREALKAQLGDFQ